MMVRKPRPALRILVGKNVSYPRFQQRALELGVLFMSRVHVTKLSKHGVESNRLRE
jgi:hypothetical protein